MKKKTMFDGEGLIDVQPVQRELDYLAFFAKNPAKSFYLRKFVVDDQQLTEREVDLIKTVVGTVIAALTHAVEEGRQDHLLSVLKTSPSLVRKEEIA